MPHRNAAFSSAFAMLLVVLGSPWLIADEIKDSKLRPVRVIYLVSSDRTESVQYTSVPPHPTDTTLNADAIMWAGTFGKYPDQTYLMDEDKKFLLRSPFFYYPDDSPVPDPGRRSFLSIDREQTWLRLDPVSKE